MTDIAIIIPSRMASARFPNKPLAQICGADGIKRSLIEHCWLAAKRAEITDQIYVATGDQEITDAVAAFGGRVLETSNAPRNGTERCAELLANGALDADIIINLQGDSPLVEPSQLKTLVDAASTSEAPMTTAYITCDNLLSQQLAEQYAGGVVGGTHVVTSSDNRALYFSKLPIPHGDKVATKLHIGLYAYTPDALREYAALPPSPLEDAEGLEQLRFLENNMDIAMIELPLPKGGFWEVNLPEDIPLIENIMRLRAVRA